MSEQELTRQRSCFCLNVTVYLKEGVDEVGKLENDGFFRQELIAGIVEYGGITVEHVYLLKSRTVGPWIINRCLNCGTDTHAMHKEKGSACVLVGKNLLSDPAEVKSLQSSEEFSPIFQIVLGEINNPSDADDAALGEAETRHSAATEAAFRAVQNQMSHFLREEEARMEERIRAFTEKQHTAFLAVQDRARADRQLLLNLLSRLEKQNVRPLIVASKPSMDGGAIPEVLPARPVNRTAAPPQQQSVSRKKAADASSPSLTSSDAAQSGIRVPSAAPRGGMAAYSLDTEILFDMEGMEQENSGEGQSEDEADTDDSGSHDEGIHIPRIRQRMDFARSLPVFVPAFTQTRLPVYDSDDERTHHEPNDIAESIKALAQSVHGDSHLFGDLPRPRFNAQH